MIEILIQLINDGKQYLYDFIRRLINYKTVIDSSIELNPEQQECLRQVIAEKKRQAKDCAFCMLAFKSSDTWELLLLNSKYKLFQMASVTTATMPFLEQLDKNETYVSRLKEI